MAKYFVSVPFSVESLLHGVVELEVNAEDADKAVELVRKMSSATLEEKGKELTDFEEIEATNEVVYEHKEPDDLEVSTSSKARQE